MDCLQISLATKQEKRTKEEKQLADSYKLLKTTKWIFSQVSLATLLITKADFVLSHLGRLFSAFHQLKCTKC